MGFETAADTAYERIRAGILGGQFQPGTKLSRRKMAAFAEVSVIPVIEALHRLENDGLVESQPHQGSIVVELTHEKLQHYATLREALECQVARELCKKELKQSEIQRLKELAQELDEHLYHNSDKSSQELAQKHHAFHTALAELTNCPPLIESLRRINLFELLKHAVVSNKKHRQIPKNWHRKLIFAIRDGNPQTAEDVFRAHIRSSRENL